MLKSDMAENNVIIYTDNDGGVNWDFTPTTESMFKQHLHRHPWVDSQALVYWVDKDDRYVESLAEVYMDWLESNPCPVAGTDSYYMGMEHSSYRIWCNLQACARIDVYIKVIQYCISSPAFTPEFLSHLLVSLYDCVECIRANYYYADTGNIRLSESNAVLNMAVMMPEFAKASEWLDESATGDVQLNWHLCPGDVTYHNHSSSYECRTAFSDGNNMSFRTFCFNGTSLNSNFTAHTGTSYTSDLPGRKYERSCYDITVNKSSSSTPVRFITVIYPFASSVPDISAEFITASRLSVTVGNEEYELSL